MKKIISIILLFTLVFSCFALWGCNSNKSKVPLKEFFKDDISYNSILVNIRCDETILPVELLDKFDKNIVINIRTYFEYDYANQSRKYYLDLNCENVFDLIRAVRNIEYIPEVIGVELTLNDWHFAEVPNDDIYSSGNQWGLEAIDIEKVWGFGKYK